MAQALWQLHLYGPQAVGKMTVGQQVARLAGARLLYNHQLIDLLTEYFPFGSDPFKRLVDGFRGQILEEAAEAEVSVVTTYGFPFDGPNRDLNIATIHEWMDCVERRGGSVYFVELRAPLDIRLERNRHEHRQAHKKLDWATDDEIRRLNDSFRWYSDNDFPFDAPYLILDVTSMPPDESALRIVEHFGLTRGNA